MANTPARQFGPAESAACRELIEAALAEDLGAAGDVTSRALVPEHSAGAARFVVRRAGVVAGLDATRLVLAEVDRAVRWKPLCHDGDAVEAGTVLARVSGRLRSLLAAERTALNFLQRLSGVATLTRTYVDSIAGLPCAIFDTRKTTPGWRVLEKYSVRAGGGRNHRMGLHDAVLIKDNHLVAWRSQSGGSLADAVRAARATVPPGTVVEIEVDSLEQLDKALLGEPDIVLLDNMSLDELRRAVAVRDARRPRLELEASGGITLATIRGVAETGVNRISVGALTHSAPALDIALDFEEPPA